MALQFPLQKIYEFNVPAVAAGADKSTTGFVAPFDATIDSVEYIPDAVLTGADTNSRTGTLFNKGQAGSGTTAIGSLAFVSGVNAPAFDSKPITKSATAADLNVAANDVVAWNSLHVGTGLADPGGMVRVTLTKREA